MTRATQELVSRRLARVGKSAADRVLDAAFRQFRRGGLAQVSLRGIARDLGVTPMAIYRHFADKEALVEALVQRGLNRFEDAYLTVAVRERRPAAGLLALCLSYVDFALAEPQLFHLLFLAHRPSTDAFLADYKAHGSSSFDRLRSQVTACMTAGELAPNDSLDIAVDLWAHTHGLCALYVAGRFGRGDALFRRFAARTLRRRLADLRPSN